MKVLCKSRQVPNRMGQNFQKIFIQFEFLFSSYFTKSILAENDLSSTQNLDIFEKRLQKGKNVFLVSNPQMITSRILSIWNIEFGWEGLFYTLIAIKVTYNDNHNHKCHKLSIIIVIVTCRHIWRVFSQYWVSPIQTRDSQRYSS